jgi:FixJ family two-component response regulator
LIASGYLDRVVKAEILDSGVRGFIEKPYRPEEILKVLREALDSR